MNGDSEFPSDSLSGLCPDRVVATDGGSSTRRFRIVEEDGERGVFTGQSPIQAATKAARRLIDDPADSEAEAKEREPTVVTIRERGTETHHSYLAHAWSAPVDEDAPDYLGDEVVEVDLEKIR